MKSFSKIFFLAFAFSIFCSMASAAEPPETIKVRVADYPPQYYQDQSGKWTGLDVELARALVVEAGLTPDFVELPWSRALSSMKSGKIQLMTTLSKTAERSTYMYWIGPERISQMILVVKKENLDLPIRTINDLPKVAAVKGLQFGMQQDVYYGAEFSKKIMDREFSKHFEAIADAKLNPLKVRAGRILGFFEDKIAMQYQIKTNPNFEGLAIHPFVLQEEEIFFGVSRTVNPKLLDRLESAYQRLEASGKLDEIRNKEWW